jgi:hypothetical protein
MVARTRPTTLTFGTVDTTCPGRLIDISPQDTMPIPTGPASEIIR